MDPCETMRALRARDTLRVLGLMSGMSRDGLDLALVEIRRGDSPRPDVQSVAATTLPYDEAWRARLLAAPQADASEVARLDVELARLWAGMVRGQLGAWGEDPARIDLVGSHGQTLHHTPRGEAGPGRPAYTLQVGHGDVLAEEIGIPVMSDFRLRDVALGGEGAPLIPYADWVRYGAEPGTTCHNLGSIANVTVLGEALADCVAFDTGPANALVDAFARMAGEPSGMDLGGRLSAQGGVDDDLHLSMWTACAAWLAKPPPKSAGFSTFDAGLAERLGAKHPDVRPADRVRTAVAFTAACLKHAYEWFICPHHPHVRRVRFSGGGTRNETLMADIRAALEPLGLEALALPAAESDAKEAIGFALLAEAGLRGLPTSVTAATGARHAAALGRLSVPSA